MLFGRNEDCGMRCIYHGWKYDVTGAVVDMPAEPPRSRLKEKVRITAYPCRERNGVVWTYMGPDEEPPPLPEMEWNLVPPENVHLSMRVQECNWLQALEGEIDSAHAPILHARIDDGGAINDWIAKRDLRPTFECMRQQFGMSIAAKRRLDEQTLYWRVNQFVLPFYSLVPPQSKFPELSGHAWVPMDDEHTLCLMFSYHPVGAAATRGPGSCSRRGTTAARPAMPAATPTTSARRRTPYADYWTRFNPDQAFRIDYEAQRTTWFSGLPGLWVQDGACQSGTGPIYDRTQENLCASDTGIVMTRRMLLESARALRDAGVRPAGATEPDTFMVRAVSMQLPEGTPWADAGRPHMTARLGAGFGYEL